MTTFGKRTVEIVEKNNEKLLFVKGDIPQVKRLYINLLTGELFTPDMDTWDWQDPFGCCRVDRYTGQFHLPLVLGDHIPRRVTLADVPPNLKWRKTGFYMGEFCFVKNGEVIEFNDDISFRYLERVGCSFYEKVTEDKVYFSEFKRVMHKADRRERDTY